uniref:Glycosyltransferase family 2 protein n=1 Tax=Erysipelothrix tonsillarum TaxID=38402 RepID=A0A6S6I6A0_9FIRM|nr:glycosyltransferase family 2 protein [Erysipelothrix tonsillarum]
MREESLVSVIVPMYNSEKTITRTINSILNQTYKNIEILVVDDISTDNSVEIIKQYMLSHSNIKLFELKEKGGASIARNLAIKKANGKYIAFLDSDDTWKHNKLACQIKFMIENDISFSYTYYEIKREDNSNIKIRTAPRRVRFINQILGNNIGCLTVIYDQEKIGKIQIPRIDKRNDMALWQKVLQKTKYGYLYPEVLSVYYVTDNSLSRNTSRTRMLKFHYNLFRANLEYNPIKSAVLSFCNILSYFKIKIFYTHDYKSIKKIELDEDHGSVVYGKNR